MSALGGKYRVGERIGGGGMADVFRAELLGAEGFARAVAVKRMKRSISSDKEFAKLFIAEARLAAKLAHPNVIQTLDFSRDEAGCFYLVMELIDGVDLRQLVQSGRVPLSACVFIISEILRALDYAHEMAFDGQPMTIVHRDISPHNIMLAWQGAVKVVDFGIAKAIAGSLVSRSGSLKGKVAYMSPEQVHGHALDGRSDLFAVGIVMHELVTGERLFVGESEAATLSKLLTQPIPQPSSRNSQVPADLDRILMKLLARDRDQRYLRARDALNDLLECSISVVRGRSDLETVLAERFPERAPRRVPRLSSQDEGVRLESESLVPSTLSSPDTLPSASTLPAATTLPGAAPSVEPSDSWVSAETVPAIPRALSPPPEDDASVALATVAAATIALTPVGPAQTEPSSLLPKRTLTAPSLPSEISKPVVLASARDEVAGRPAIPRGAWALIGVLLVAAMGVVVMWRSGLFQTQPERAAVKLVTPSNAAAGNEVAPDTSLRAQTTPASRDAGTLASATDSNAAVVAANLASANDVALDAGVHAAEELDDEPDRKPVKKARLTLSVKPWAVVIVDGKRYGQTPQTIELSEGRHRVTVENEGLDRKESFSVTLKAGQKKTIDKDWR